MIEQQLQEFFQDSAPIRDRVAERIFAKGEAEQGTRGERIDLQLISRKPAHQLNGESGIHEVVVQVDCYAADPYSADTLAETVRNRLSGYRGVIGNTNPALVQSCEIVSDGADAEEPENSSDRWIHRFRMDFALYVSASVPTFA